MHNFTLPRVLRLPAFALVFFLSFSFMSLEINTNAAESFFSRMRRGEVGHHHHIAGPYLLRFAQEAAWRENYRRAANGTQVDRIVALAMHNKPSVDFCGYWQRSRAAA